MKLSEKDAELFFELMWALQHFTNWQLDILPDIRRQEDYIDCSLDEKIQVREAIYENFETILDAFIKENPAKLSAEKLDIVAKWKHFVEGEFYVERLLKKHAIFIADDNVYAVLAIRDPFDELFDRSGLPVLIRTVLLPFRDKIIYDGVFEGYNIFFGRGISTDLKEAYLGAKQYARIIDTLDPAVRASRAKKSPKKLKNWQPEIDKLMERAQKLRGGSGQPPIYSPAFSLVKASLEFAQYAVSNQQHDTDTLFKKLEKIERAFRKLEDTTYRSERYR